MHAYITIKVMNVYLNLFMSILSINVNKNLDHNQKNAFFVLALDVSLHKLCHLRLTNVSVEQVYRSFNQAR